MRRLLFVLIVVLGCGIALGFYRGWFDLSIGGSGGQRNITLSVDQEKIKADQKQARDQLPTIGTPAKN